MFQRQTQLVFLHTKHLGGRSQHPILQQVMQGFFVLHPGRQQGCFGGGFTITDVQFSDCSQFLFLPQVNAQALGCSQVLGFTQQADVQGFDLSQDFGLTFVHGFELVFGGQGFGGGQSLHPVFITKSGFLQQQLLTLQFATGSGFLQQHFLIGQVGAGGGQEGFRWETQSQGFFPHDVVHGAAGVCGRHRLLERDRKKGILTEDVSPRI